MCVLGGLAALVFQAVQAASGLLEDTKINAAPLIIIISSSRGIEEHRFWLGFSSATLSFYACYANVGAFHDESLSLCVGLVFRVHADCGSCNCWMEMKRIRCPLKPYSSCHSLLASSPSRILLLAVKRIDDGCTTTRSFGLLWL